MVKELLKPCRGHDDLRIDDLVHLAAVIVPQVAGPQGRYKVAPIPDARTVRYYIQEGLVDPPHGSSGPAALYGYRHLLQLVTVKVLQSHYLPIRRIRETIEGLDDRELEKILEGWRSTDPEPSDGTAPAARAIETTPGPSAARDDSSPRAFLQSLAGPTPSQAEVRYQRYFLPGEAATPPEPGGWTRYELYPGIELHVKDGTPLPASGSFFSALSSRLRVILSKMKGSRP